MTLAPNFLELTWAECSWMISTLVPEPGFNSMMDNDSNQNRDGAGELKREGDPPVPLPQVEELLADDTSKSWTHYPAHHWPFCHTWHHLRVEWELTWVEDSVQKVWNCKALKFYLLWRGQCRPRDCKLLTTWQNVVNTSIHHQQVSDHDLHAVLSASASQRPFSSFCIHCLC